MTQDNQDLDAPGWKLLDSAFSALHRGQTPHQFSSSTPYDFASANPLPAITVWESREPDGRLSWQYVTYGLTELFEKTTDDQSTSGLGFELVFRILRQPQETPPTAPLRLLQQLARELLAHGSGVETGDCMAIGVPVVDASRSSPLDHLVCVPDPRLPELNGPFGRFVLMGLIGLQGDEAAMLLELDSLQRAHLMREIAPTGLTDATRTSYLQDENSLKAVRRYRLGVQW